MAKIELIKGDCLIEMQNIPDKSVDMILLDPPYELQTDDFVNNINGIVIPKLKNNGVIIWFSKMPHNATVQYLTSKRINFINEYIWFFTDTSCFRSKSMPLINHQNITIYSNSKEKIVLDNVRITNRRKDIKLHYKGSKHRGKEGNKIYWEPNKKGGWCSSVIEIQKTQKGDILKIKDKPIGVKPILLFEFLMNGYTNINDTILDPFMGIGTSLISSLNTGRNLIGIEKDENYFKIAEQRINDTKYKLF